MTTVSQAPDILSAETDPYAAYRIMRDQMP
jgi:hypothetical protein